MLESLERQIADLIIDAWDEDERLSPSKWQIQADHNHKYLRLFRYTPPNADAFERAGLNELKSITVELPFGYSNEEYEEALEGLFPDTRHNEGTAMAHNASVRVIGRKSFEDALYKYEKSQVEMLLETLLDQLKSLSVTRL